jgi:hypothetical protein
MKTGIASGKLMERLVSAAELQLSDMSLSDTARCVSAPTHCILV